VDFLATVASFPKPDDKIRSTSLKVSLFPSFPLSLCFLFLLFIIINNNTVGLPVRCKEVEMRGMR
jgi:hypothetical protein